MEHPLYFVAVYFICSISSIYVGYNENYYLFKHCSWFYLKFSGAGVLIKTSIPGTGRLHLLSHWL